MKRTLFVLAAAATLLVAVAPQPASGVVHEIVGQWCAGQGELEPFGLSRDGSKNFAAPLVKSGVVSVHPFVGAAGPGLLIDFDFTKPQVKIAPTGNIVQIGSIPGVGPLYLEEFVLGDRAPFTVCKRLQT
ncbi:MAG TPA: hypothetical protein VNK94_11330 [Gaiellaceae bacterium]|jgi:hypothetical protein|nr:hypothetical protein [Gaiellaceae bacterium]